MTRDLQLLFYYCNLEMASNARSHKKKIAATRMKKTFALLCGAICELKESIFSHCMSCHILAADMNMKNVPHAQQQQILTNIFICGFPFEAQTIHFLFYSFDIYYYYLRVLRFVPRFLQCSE